MSKCFKTFRGTSNVSRREGGWTISTDKVLGKIFDRKWFNLKDLNSTFYLTADSSVSCCPQVRSFSKFLHVNEKVSTSLNDNKGWKHVWEHSWRRPLAELKVEPYLFVIDEIWSIFFCWVQRMFDSCLFRSKSPLEFYFVNGNIRNCSQLDDVSLGEIFFKTKEI